MVTECFWALLLGWGKVLTMQRIRHSFKISCGGWHLFGSRPTVSMPVMRIIIVAWCAQMVVHAHQIYTDLCVINIHLFVYKCRGVVVREVMKNWCVTWKWVALGWGLVVQGDELRGWLTGAQGAEVCVMITIREAFLNLEYSFLVALWPWGWWGGGKKCNTNGRDLKSWRNVR